MALQEACLSGRGEKREMQGRGLRNNISPGCSGEDSTNTGVSRMLDLRATSQIGLLGVPNTAMW